MCPLSAEPHKEESLTRGAFIPPAQQQQTGILRNCNNPARPIRELFYDHPDESMPDPGAIVEPMKPPIIAINPAPDIG